MISRKGPNLPPDLWSKTVSNVESNSCARHDAVTYSDVHQRMNANGFNAIWFILLNRHNINFNIINKHLNILLKGLLKVLTLCTLVPLCHAWLLLPPSSFSMLSPSLLRVDWLSPLLGADCFLICWGLTAYLPPCLGGPDLPHLLLRSQATPYSCVGHNSDEINV